MLELVKTLHIFAAFTVVASLSAVVIHVRNGGTKQDNGSRSLMGAAHGAGLLLSLITGMAMLGMMGQGLPAWVFVKMAIWIVLGGCTALLHRKPETATGIWLAAVLLPGAAAYLAIAKPFW